MDGWIDRIKKNNTSAIKRHQVFCVWKNTLHPIESFSPWRSTVLSHTPNDRDKHPSMTPCFIIVNETLPSPPAACLSSWVQHSRRVRATIPQSKQHRPSCPHCHRTYFPWTPSISSQTTITLPVSPKSCITQQALDTSIKRWAQGQSDLSHGIERKTFVSFSVSLLICLQYSRSVNSIQTLKIRSRLRVNKTLTLHTHPDRA